MKLRRFKLFLQWEFGKNISFTTHTIEKRNQNKLQALELYFTGKGFLDFTELSKI